MLNEVKSWVICLFLVHPFFIIMNYHNPSLGLAIKAKVYKGASQEGSLEVTFHAHENVRECEGMNPHTPKGAFTMGVRVPVDSQIFRK